MTTDHLVTTVTTQLGSVFEIKPVGFLIAVIFVVFMIGLAIVGLSSSGSKVKSRKRSKAKTRTGEPRPKPASRKVAKPKPTKAEPAAEKRPTMMPRVKETAPAPEPKPEVVPFKGHGGPFDGILDQPSSVRAAWGKTVTPYANGHDTEADKPTPPPRKPGIPVKKAGKKGR